MLGNRERFPEVRSHVLEIITEPELIITCSDNLK